MLRFVLTLANSIIGVSILAMPFCFKQCGVVLATLLLLLAGAIVKLTCHFLLKSAILARRRNYELLAFQTFGSGGKLAVETCMIGFLIGTCVAFFVVMGDLAPPIVAAAAEVESTANLRMVILVGLGLFVALPLALLRNVESLAGICTASIGFYCLVLLYIVIASWPSLVEGSWTSLVNYWRPAGIFQCLPIFCMALSCQPQIFEIYDALSDPSVNVMTDVVRGAINLCSGCYICVGFFGYVAFCGTTEVGGNVLTSFPQTMVVQTIKLGFVLSVAVSFPLVIFPCRTSIHSLIFRKIGTVPTEMVSNYIPPDRFNAITVCVILLTLALGIALPDIEFVLGMVGSTIGCAICILFPSLIFLRLTSKNTTERIAARAVLAAGLAVMVLGTYSNLREANRGPDTVYLNPAEEEAHRAHRFGNPPPLAAQPWAPSDSPKVLDSTNGSLADKKPPDKAKSSVPPQLKADEDKEGKRQEPVEPKPPKENKEEGKEKEKNEVKPKKEEVKPKQDETKIVEEPQGSTKSNNSSGTRELTEREKELQMREKKADKLLEELEKQKVEQKQIIEEQKEVLQQLKDVAADKKEEDSENANDDLEHLQDSVGVVGGGVQSQSLVDGGQVVQHQELEKQQLPLQSHQAQQQRGQDPVNWNELEQEKSQQKVLRNEQQQQQQQHQEQLPRRPVSNERQEERAPHQQQQPAVPRQFQEDRMQQQQLPSLQEPFLEQHLPQQPLQQQQLPQQHMKQPPQQQPPQQPFPLQQQQKLGQQLSQEQQQQSQVHVVQAQPPRQSRKSSQEKVEIPNRDPLHGPTPKSFSKKPSKTKDKLVDKRETVKVPFSKDRKRPMARKEGVGKEEKVPGRDLKHYEAADHVRREKREVCVGCDADDDGKQPGKVAMRALQAVEGYNL